MSYKIFYHKEKKEGTLGYRMQIPIAAVLVLITLINGIYHFTGKGEPLRELLLPWTQPKVLEAYSVFTDNLKNGESFLESVETFCLDILGDEN